MLATRLVRVEIIDVFSGLGTEIAPGLLPKDADALMGKVLVNGTKSFAATARRLVQAAQEWSRPARVAGHAIADVRLTKADLIAENALLRQQLIAAKRHLGRPLFSKPEKVATTIGARLTTRWQTTFLLFQPETILRWHREMFRIVWWKKSRRKGKTRPSSSERR